MNISCFFDISAKQLGVYNFLDLFQNFFIVKNTIAILHGQKFKNLDPPLPLQTSYGVHIQYKKVNDTGKLITKD